MLEKITPEATRNLVQIRSMPAIDAMLSAELAKVYETMASHQNPVVIHQLQGKAQFISDLRKTIATATVSP